MELLKKRLAQINLVLATFAAFLLSLDKRLLIWTLAAWAFFWLVGIILDPKRLVALHNRWFYLIVGFYLLHGVGLLYTSNMEAGAFEMEVKFSFLIIPLIFFSSPEVVARRKYLYTSFVAGVIAGGVFCFIYAAYRLYNGFPGAMYYMSFSYFHHPTYFALFACFSAVILFRTLEQRKMVFSKKSFFPVILLFFLSSVLYFLSSKAGLIAYLMVMGIYSVYLAICYRKFWIIILVVFFSLAYVLLLYSANERIKGANKFASQEVGNINSTESSAARMHIWKASIPVIKNNFLFGTGTGDSKDKLIESYRNFGMTHAVEIRYNAHNQYIETLMALGLPGLLWLLTMLICPFYSALKKRNIYLIGLIVLVGFNFLFESMLNTQAGVIFIAYFLSLLLASLKNSDSYVNSFFSTTD